MTDQEAFKWLIVAFAFLMGNLDIWCPSRYPDNHWARFLPRIKVFMWGAVFGVWLKN